MSAYISLSLAHRVVNLTWLTFDKPEEVFPTFNSSIFSCRLGLTTIFDLLGKFILFNRTTKASPRSRAQLEKPTFFFADG